VEPDLTRRLLRDLREIRQAKARKGVETVGETHIQMDNIGMMEITEIRFLNQSMDRLRLLNGAKSDRDDTTEIDVNGEYD
jgi:GINS complex subunit 2